MGASVFRALDHFHSKPTASPMGPTVQVGSGDDYVGSGDAYCRFCYGVSHLYLCDVLVARNRFSACSTLPWTMRLLKNSRGALCRYVNAEKNFNLKSNYAYNVALLHFTGGYREEGHDCPAASPPASAAAAAAASIATRSRHHPRRISNSPFTPSPFLAVCLSNPRCSQLTTHRVVNIRCN
jgi:hypothetical protein